MKTYTIAIVHDAQGVPVRIRRQQEQPDLSGRAPNRGPGKLNPGETFDVIATGVTPEQLATVIKRAHRQYLKDTRPSTTSVKVRGFTVRKAKVNLVEGEGNHYEFAVPAWPPPESY